MKDWRGVRVVVGDRVIYSTRQGSSMTIVEGNVLEVTENIATVHVVNDSWYSFHPRKRPARVSGRFLTVVTGLPEPEAADDSA